MDLPPMAVIKLEIEEPEAEDERQARFEEKPSGPVQVEQPLPVVENARAQEEPPAVPIQEEAPKLEKQRGPKKGLFSGKYRCSYCLFTCHDLGNLNTHKKCHNKYQSSKEKCYFFLATSQLWVKIGTLKK